jgi:hypothetical protein
MGDGKESGENPPNSTLFRDAAMPDTVFIYALRDPDTNEIRYVGKSMDPMERLKQHLSGAEFRRTHKDRWLCSAMSRGLPVLELVAEVPAPEWPMWEVAYIQFFRDEGCHLVNGNDGGEGGSNPVKEVRDKISQSKLGPRNPNFGKKMSPESIAKRLLAIVGKKRAPHSEEHRARLSAALKGRAVWNKGISGPKQSAETIEKRAEKNRGQKRSVEFCENLRLRRLGKKTSEETRAKLRGYRLGTKLSEETRAKIGAASKTYWAIRKSKNNE